MKNYIGITIGPIFDTMSLTSSPVALWASSYIFSTLSKTLCRLLTENGVKEESIITPYYKADEPLLNKNNGVGLFHDRIIFAADDFDISKMNGIKSRAIEEIAALFGVDSGYLTEYVMVSCAGFEAENPILDSAQLLDCLELAKPFVAVDRENNPILHLFAGDEYSHNSGLKKTGLISGLSEFQLKKTENTFKSLEDIYSGGNAANKEYKKFKYYAIIRSDADNMSEIIKSLDGDDKQSADEKIREFSKTCLAYCSDVAEKVKEYNGVTIYSGGDDLLAILPCESGNAKTPFHFAADANAIFDSHFSAYGKDTSLSFGITMAYGKFPLFEALEDSANLLFGVAKKDEKNRIAVRLQKHAGQSEGLVISNDSLGLFTELLEYIRKDKEKGTTGSEAILSVMHKLLTFETMFNNTYNDAQITNLFENVFDADRQKEDTFLTECLPRFFKKLKRDGGIDAITDKGIEKDDISKSTNYVLRICKFFIEEGGEE